MDSVLKCLASIRYYASRLAVVLGGQRRQQTTFERVAACTRLRSVDQARLAALRARRVRDWPVGKEVGRCRCEFH